MLSLVATLLVGLVVGVVISHVFLNRQHYGPGWRGLQWQGPVALRRSLSAWLYMLASTIAPAGEHTRSFAGGPVNPRPAAATSSDSAQPAENTHAVGLTGSGLQEGEQASAPRPASAQATVPAHAQSAPAASTASHLQQPVADSTLPLRPSTGLGLPPSSRRKSLQADKVISSRGDTSLQLSSLVASTHRRAKSRAEDLTIQDAAVPHDDALTMALSQPYTAGPSLLQLHGRSPAPPWQMATHHDAVNLHRQLPTFAAAPSVTLQLDDAPSEGTVDSKITASCSPSHALPVSSLAVATPPRIPGGLKRLNARSHSADRHSFAVIAAANRAVSSFMESASSSPTQQNTMQQAQPGELRATRSVTSPKASDAAPLPFPLGPQMAFLFGPQSAPQLQGRGCTSPTRMRSPRTARRSVEESPTMAQLPIYNQLATTDLSSSQASLPSTCASLREYSLGVLAQSGSSGSLLAPAHAASSKMRPRPRSAANLGSPQPGVIQRSRMSAESSCVPPPSSIPVQLTAQGDGAQPDAPQASNSSAGSSAVRGGMVSSGSESSMLRPRLSKLRPGISWGGVLVAASDDSLRGELESMLSTASSAVYRHMLSEQYATIGPSMAGMVERDDMLATNNDMKLAALLQQHLDQTNPANPRDIRDSACVLDRHADLGLSAFSFSPTARTQQGELQGRDSHTGLPQGYMQPSDLASGNAIQHRDLRVKTVRSARWEQTECDTPTMTHPPGTPSGAMTASYVPIPEDILPSIARARRAPKAHRSFYHSEARTPGHIMRGSVDYTSSPRRSSALVMGSSVVMSWDRSSCPNVQRTRANDSAVHDAVQEPEAPAPTTYDIMAAAFGWNVSEQDRFSDGSQAHSEDMQKVESTAAMDQPDVTDTEEAATALTVPASPESDTQQAQAIAEMMANTWRSLPQSNIEQLGLDYLTRNSRSSANTPTKRQPYPKSCPTGARTSLLNQRVTQDETSGQNDDSRVYGKPQSKSLAARSALRSSTTGMALEEPGSSEDLLNCLADKEHMKAAFDRYSSLQEPPARTSTSGFDASAVSLAVQPHSASDDGQNMVAAAAAAAVSARASVTSVAAEPGEHDSRGLLKSHTRFRAAKSVQFKCDDDTLITQPSGDENSTLQPDKPDAGLGSKGMSAGSAGLDAEQPVSGAGSEAQSPFGKYVLPGVDHMQKTRLGVPRVPSAASKGHHDPPLRRSSSQSITQPAGVQKLTTSHRRYSSIMLGDGNDSELGQLGSMNCNTSMSTARCSLQYSSSRPSDSRSSHAPGRSARQSATPSRASSMHRRQKSSSGTNVYSPGAGNKRLSHAQSSSKDRCKVLLVAADAQKIDAVHAALTSKRYSIVHATASECVAMLADGSKVHLPDVILVDCMLGNNKMLPGLSTSRSRLHAVFQDTPTKSKPSSLASTDALLGSSDSPHHPTHTEAAAAHAAEQQEDNQDPDLTALELIHQIRASHDPSVMPVIMLTGPQAPFNAGCPVHSINPGALAAAAASSSSSPAEKGTCVHAMPAVSTLVTAADAALLISPAVAAGVEALKKGANDYVVLPVVSIELEARIGMHVALRRAARVKADQDSSMTLLRALLPDYLIKKLKSGVKYIAQYHKDVSIGFIDIVQFTQMSANWPSGKVAHMLNSLFGDFDKICERHGVYHVDTIGDGYMVLCGHSGEPDHALRLVRAAAEMLEISKLPVACGKDEKGQIIWERVRLRIGISSGPAHSGVLGIKRCKYTVWGDSVNVASRMESTGFPGCIQVHSSTYDNCWSSMRRHRQHVPRPSTPSDRPQRMLDTLTGSDRPSFDCSTATGATNTTHLLNSPLDSSPRYGPESMYGSVTSGLDRERGSVGDQSSHTGWLGTPRSSDYGEPPEFEFSSLGLRLIKGKGYMATYVVQVGEWRTAVTTTAQACVSTDQNWQMPHAASTISPDSLNTQMMPQDWVRQQHSAPLDHPPPHPLVPTSSNPEIWSANVALWQAAGPASPAAATNHDSAASAPAALQAAPPHLRLVLPPSPAGQHNSADAVHMMNAQQLLQRANTRPSPASASQFFSPASSTLPMSSGPFSQQFNYTPPRLLSRLSAHEAGAGSSIPDPMAASPHQRVASQRKLPGFDMALDSTVSQDFDELAMNLLRGGTYCRDSTLGSTYCRDSTVGRDSGDPGTEPQQAGMPWGISGGSSRSSQPFSSQARSSRLANSSQSSQSFPGQIDKLSGKLPKVSSEMLRALRSQGEGLSSPRSAGMQEQVEAQLRAMLGPHCLDNVHRNKRAQLVSWMQDQIWQNSAAVMADMAEQCSSSAGNTPAVQLNRQPLSGGNAVGVFIRPQDALGLLRPDDLAAGPSHAVNQLQGTGHVVMTPKKSQSSTGTDGRQVGGPANPFRGSMTSSGNNAVFGQEPLQLKASKSEEGTELVMDGAVANGAADQLIPAQQHVPVSGRNPSNSGSHASATSASRFKSATSESSTSARQSSGTQANSSARPSANQGETTTPKRERISKGFLSGSMKARSGSHVSVLRTMSKLCKETVEKLTSSFSLSQGSSNHGPPSAPASDRRRAVSFCDPKNPPADSLGVQPGAAPLLTRTAQSTNGACSSYVDQTPIKPRPVSSSGQAQLTGGPSNLSLPLKSMLLDARTSSGAHSAKSHSGVCPSGGSGTALQYRLTPQGTLEPSSSTKSEQPAVPSTPHNIPDSAQNSPNIATYLYYTSSGQHDTQPGDPTGSWTAGRPSTLGDKPGEPTGSWTGGRLSLLNDNYSKLPMPELQEAKVGVKWAETMDDKARTITLPTMQQFVGDHGLQKASSAHGLTSGVLSLLVGDQKSPNTNDHGAARSDGRSYDGSQGSSVTSKGSKRKAIKRIFSNLFKGSKEKSDG